MSDSLVPAPREPYTPDFLADVDIKRELAIRHSRAPDYQAKDRAFARLAAHLAEDPQSMLQKLAETALDLCRADTAGLSFPETQDGKEVFRWVALAGLLAVQRNNTIPRDACPCGICVDQDAPQLMYFADRRFPGLRSDPRFVEALVIPFHDQKRPVGTVWVVMQQCERRFDGEDQRILETLAAFASAGWQLWRASLAQAGMNAALNEQIEARKKSEIELRRVQEQLRKLPGLLLQAHEDERRVLAGELRDNFGQILASLSLDASAMQDSAPDREIPRRLLLKEIADLSNQIHAFSEYLRPALLDDLGLEPALREECSNFSQRCCIQVRFDAENVPRHLPEKIGLCLFRVGQESLRNIAEHSGAGEVQVLLAADSNEITLSVRDTGGGFDIGQKREGLGLFSMEQRVRAVHGHFDISSLPGMGTTVEVRVPLAKLAD